MVAIMRPFGCGKTTFLNCMSGLDDMDGGEVLVAGGPIGEMSDRRDVRQKRTSFRTHKMRSTFKSYNLIPVLSAVENVELSLLVAGSKPKKAADSPCSPSSWSVSPTRRASARPSLAAGSSSGSTGLFGIGLGLALGADPLRDYAGSRPF
jgi:ABC-type polar amino acid transport system ATPase subunit